MLKIQFAEGLIDKLYFNNIDDFQKYPRANLTCSTCEHEIAFALQNLYKHKGLQFSNLKGKDKAEADNLILSMIPRHKLRQEKRPYSMTLKERLIVFFQRIYLRMIGLKGTFLAVPKTRDNVPDSFLDYNCPNCKKPIRIYYSSYLGGRHGEEGFKIMYIIN